MSDILCWNKKEEIGLSQFKERLRDLDLNNELFEDRRLINWLYAREFRLDDAEVMLRKHLTWRKENNINNILKCDTAISRAAKTLSGDILGVDNDNNVVLGVFATPIDFNKMLHHFGKIGTLELFSVLLESACLEVVTRSKGCTRLKKVVYIDDLEGIRLKDYFSADVLDVLIAILTCIDANYPEMLSKAYIINVPSLFTGLWNIVRPLLSPRTVDKIVILGQNEGRIRNCLLENIPKSQLPPKWGGTYHSERAPQLNINMMTEVKEENLQQFKQVLIPFGELFDVVLSIEKSNTIISWKFQTESYDVGFVIHYKPNFPMPDSSVCIVSSEINSYKRLSSHKSLQIGKLVCCTPGEYRLQFDNTYSRYRSKMLYYQVSTSNDN